MSKIIKDGIGTVIKPEPQLVETRMEDFIKMIDEAQEEGVFDEVVADSEEITKNETSARLLKLIEDCIDTYCEMHKRRTKGEFVKFGIEFKLAPLFEGDYMGKATCNFIKWEYGKKKVLISKVFGFQNVGQMRKNDWGEQLLVQVVTELIGCAHVLSNIRDGVKHTDLTKEKFRHRNLRDKK